MAPSGSDIVEISDKKAGKHAPAAPAEPQFQFQPSAGDYREAQARTALSLTESNTFLFHDLHLPENKALLGIINQAMKAMPADENTARIGLNNDDVLALKTKDGKLDQAVLMHPDKATDFAQFDAKGNVTQETTISPLGITQRTYRTDHSVSREDNETNGYKGFVEFDTKGKIVHSHDENATDIKDSLRNPDGSGVETIVHKSSDPTEAYTQATVYNTDQTIVADKKFNDGNFEHLELDKNDRVTKAVKSNLSKGYIEHHEVKPDGTYNDFREQLT
ncbi:MAG TPA: hypothetical protein V6C86_25615 [Oculatellaceae cyanobacterium]